MKKMNFKATNKKRIIPIVGIFIIIVASCALIYINKMKADYVNPAKVEVLPLVRSAYFQFNLFQFPNINKNFFDNEKSIPNIKKPLVEYPKVHTAKIYWRTSNTNFTCDKNIDNWSSGQEFERVQGNFGQSRGQEPRVNTLPAYYNDPRMATMLMGLVENSSYDYKIIFSDGGDGSFPTTPVCGSFSTLSTDAPHTDRPDEQILQITKDTQNVTSAMTAYLNSSDASGKRIKFVADPNSNETLIRNFGTAQMNWQQLKASPGNWLVIEGDENKKVVLDGSNPRYDVTGQGLWEKCDSSNSFCGQSISKIGDNQINSIYRTKDPYVNNSGTGIGPDEVYYETADGTMERLSKTNWIPYGVNDLNEMVRRITTISTGEGSFFVANDSRLYAHLNEGVDPNSVHIKIPIYQHPFVMANSNNIIFKNFSYQYFYTYSDSTVGQIEIGNGQDIIFKNVNFKGPVGIHTSGGDNQRILVKNCTFSGGFVPYYDNTTGTWKGHDWYGVKGSREDRALLSSQGHAISVLDSKFIGAHDAITPDGAATAFNDYTLYPNPTNPSPPYNIDDSWNINRQDLAWEIDNNYFKGTEDDAVEMRVALVGAAITRNRFDGVYNDISAAPLVGGPIYIVRNLSVKPGNFLVLNHNVASFLKMGNQNYSTDTSYKLVANNTIINVNTNYSKDPRGGGTSSFTEQGRIFNYHVFNNIAVSDTIPIDFSGDVASGPAGSNSCYPQIFDNNFYIATRFEMSRGAIGSMFAIVNACAQQGDINDGGDQWGHRGALTFDDWKNGVGNTGRSGNHWPVTTPTLMVDGDDLHSTQFPWLHDTKGAFKDYYTNQGDAKKAPNDLMLTGFDMSDPGNITSTLNTDAFKPQTGNPAINMGRSLPNVTYDVGPGWASTTSGTIGSNYDNVSYIWPSFNEPTGAVTTGVIPGPSNEGSIVLNIPTNQRTQHVYPTRNISISPEVSGATAYQWSKVSGPTNGNATFSAATSSNTNVSFDAPGTYTIALTASDSLNHSATRQLTIYVHKYGDINNNNSVDFPDFTLLLSNWGAPNNAMADLNSDGAVDFKDFTILLSNWG